MYKANECGQMVTFFQMILNKMENFRILVSWFQLYSVQCFHHFFLADWPCSATDLVEVILEKFLPDCHKYYYPFNTPFLNSIAKSLSADDIILSRALLSKNILFRYFLPSLPG